MTTRRIFVHGRMAHMDDLTAAALVIYANPEDKFEVVRDDTHLDTAEMKDFIVDCGGHYDGHRLFDHHQLRPETPTSGTECAATLAAAHMAPWIFEDPRYKGAFEKLRVLDTLGPDIHGERYGETWDLSQEVLVQFFEEHPTEAAEQVAKTLARREYVGKMMPTYRHWLDNNAKIYGDDKDKVLVVGDPWTEFDPLKDLRGMTEAIGYHAKEHGCVATVSWDYKDQCWSLFRTFTGQKARLNLYKCKPTRLHFKHTGGFLCKYFGDLDEWRELIKQARPE